MEQAHEPEQAPAAKADRTTGPPPAPRGAAANLLSLQRRAGNAAVVRFLQRSDGGVVRRSVGFEFEDGTWQPWKRVYQPGSTIEKVHGGLDALGLGGVVEGCFEKGNVDPAARKEVVHHGPGYTVEGDDTGGKYVPSMEFVTKPFDETTAGLQQFMTTATDIQAVFQRLAPYVGRAGIQGQEDPPYVFGDANKWVEDHEHGFAGGPTVKPADVVLSDGTATGHLKMQATVSGAMADLPTTMEYVGQPGVGAQVAANDQQPARDQLRGVAPVTAADRLTGETPAVARAASGAILQQAGPQSAVSAAAPNQQAFDTLVANPDPSLDGFLSAVVLVVKALQIPLDGPLKYRVPLLPRRSFVTMFQSLDPSYRHLLSFNGAALLVAEVLAASNARPLLVNGVDGNLGANTPIVAAPVATGTNSAPVAAYTRLQGITIGAWLTGITQGQDLLAPSDLDGWLRNAQLSDADRTQSLGLVESFASLEDDPNAAALPANIFENRNILERQLNHNNNSLPVGDVDATLRRAWNYLLFYKRWRTNGQPGAFPNNNLGVP